MRNLQFLLERAKAGTISDEDVEAVASELRANPRARHAYTMLHIVGRAFATRHRDLVESYLEAEWDPMLARLALQIVCNFWGETSRYLGRVFSALQGLSWDREDDVKQIAISIAGEYLRKHKNRELLKTVFGIFNDASEDMTIREAAYLALGRACGREWSELPPASRRFDIQADTDGAIISQVQAAVKETG